MAKNTSSWGWRGILNLFAFVAVVCIGLALLIGKIGGGQLAGALTKVAECVAYTLTAISAFFFVHSRRHWAYYLVWVVCVVLIVVLMFL